MNKSNETVVKEDERRSPCTSPEEVVCDLIDGLIEKTNGMSDGDARWAIFMMFGVLRKNIKESDPRKSLSEASQRLRRML